MSGRGTVEIVGIGVAWDELLPGQRLRTVGRTLREADIVIFCGLTGLLPAEVVDAEFRSKHGPDSRVAGTPQRVPPILVYSLAEGLLANWDRGSGLGFDALDLTVQAPCRLGDTIHLDLEVVDISGPLPDGRGRVTTYQVVRNQRGEALIAYRQTRVLRGRTERDRLATI
ncbi:MAG: hypothetical protein U1E97_10340 [Alphaproteobacteria bacterium]